MFQRFRSKVFWTRSTLPATLVFTVFCTSLTVNADTTLSTTVIDDARKKSLRRGGCVPDDAHAGWMQIMTLSKDLKFVIS